TDRLPNAGTATGPAQRVARRRGAVQPGQGGLPVRGVAIVGQPQSHVRALLAEARRAIRACGSDREPVVRRVLPSRRASGTLRIAAARPLSSDVRIAVVD